MLIPSWIDSDEKIPDPFGYGQRAVEWLRKLKHPKNLAPGHPFQLDPWQERIILKIYGPRHLDDVYDDGILVARKGSRIVRRVILVLTRGSRKTSLAAAINLLHLIGPEKEAGSLIVSAAAAHEQALELFQESALIIESDRRLSSHVRILRGNNHTMTFGKQNIRYKAVASDGKVQHGKTPKVVIADELHAWEGRAGRSQWEALDSALVKIPETLMVVATTAGKGEDNLAFEIVQHAIKVQKGEIDDPATLPAIFMLEEGDDWKSEAVWKALNPGMRYGYPNLAGYRDKAKKAIDSPSERQSFLQFNLNLWQAKTTSPFVDMATYDKGNRPIPEGIDGLPAFIAVDMSATTDLTAVVACVPHGDDYLILPYFFLPADNLQSRGDRDNAPYVAWAEQGHLIATPGNVIDYRAVEACIRGLCERFDVREIGFDRALARPVMGPLMDDGLPVVEIEQKWQVQTPALNALEKVILEGHFIHAGHPVLRMCFANIAVHHWGNSNRAFRKDKSTGRIDGAVASWMVISRAIACDTGPSLWDDPTLTPGDFVS
ncbi:terminase large subunit [Bradyrhizobium sp. WSM 1704]|uniref:terminase large subunit n=1 Tax=Bradyrhizobium semiaridum TaxID=2821404 RepID=UPI001CE27960|nr:terminase TerL endonuclease subunit [Bradyrhizobium semiaridum]MCA6124567.1 terminase large subunit [Bradyrhizobium semiaridum]